MILTVTINPLLERRYTFTSASFKTANRNGRLSLKVGGKGINVSRQLNYLGIPNIALTFSGGVNGKLFKEELKKEKINHSIIPVYSETRECTVIIVKSSAKAASFFSENSEITKEEVKSFLDQMEKMISNCEMVIFSGSSACKETEIIFPEGIRIANELGKISFCDTYGVHLQNCIDASPTLLHNNIEEIDSSLDWDLKSENEIIDLLNYFYKKGIRQSYITDGSNDFYCSNFDFHYKVKLPKIDVIDSTGSGDAFAAGIIYGWVNRLTFNEQTKFASALGICNAQSFDVCNIEKSLSEKFIDQVEIEPIGKKIKIIDDTPR